MGVAEIFGLKLGEIFLEFFARVFAQNGGRSSVVEQWVVVPLAAGSIPVDRPRSQKKITFLENPPPRRGRFFLRAIFRVFGGLVGRWGSPRKNNGVFGERFFRNFRDFLG